jgi:23S rRNA (cytosine1962-C5)-methyltransferase
VLDCFTNQGGFALACAKAGAAKVTAVDISGPACASARKNAELNCLDIEVIEANVFDFLKAAQPEYDLIILDPPSFTKNKKPLMDAMRGYKEIHLRSLKLLEKDGLLSTFCCSHHASRELFLENLADASVDAKKIPPPSRRAHPAPRSPGPNHPPGNLLPKRLDLPSHRHELKPPAKWLAHPAPGR